MLKNVKIINKATICTCLDRLIILLLVISLFSNSLGFSITSLAVIVAAALFLLSLSFLRNKIVLSSSLWLVTGGYFFAQLVCSAFAIYPYYSLIWSVKYIVLYALQFFLLIALIKTRNWFYVALVAWIAGVILVDANISWNYLSAGLGRRSVKYLLELSVFQLPDWLNCLVWPWLLALLATTEKRSRRLVVLALLIVLSGTIFNGGRNAWLAIILETGLFLLVLKKYRWSGYTLVAIIFIVTGMFQLPYLKSRLLLFFDSDARTNINRVMLWRYSLDVWRDFPTFGIGNGSTFQTVFNQFYQQGFVFKERVAHAHNIFLARLVETGIVGLLAFVCFVGGYLQNFWCQFRSSATANPLLLAGFVSLVGWLGMGMFDYSLHLTQITRALWIMCGLTVVAGRLWGASSQAVK